MSEILLVAIDESQQSLKAIDYSVKLAGASNFTIVLLHVQPKISTYYANKKIGKSNLLKHKEEEAMKILEKGKNHIREEVQVQAKWRLGITAREICAEAREIQAIGIIMGTKTMKKVKGRLLGSTCHSVICGSPCPVTVVS
ncbi:universal stress protein [Aquibacillus koreensis]|uniref:Universal stress protein n=1 Tax=Aquibacillus koreensis TaxID=279446 RepID=A0A9X3WJ27_9BACI|nr:universal stress protein [Aquibacillus koreensis]MCT2534356.1 universal stress protein [Aquibacillus koreensis]MDC3420677.1 universal stress protein [Aquibacillus koreensis]